MMTPIIIDPQIADLKSAKATGGNLFRQLQRCINEIVLAFSYPRLDMEVSIFIPAWPFV